jgi:hypothetical protein
VCFEFDDAAEGAGFDEFAEGDEVGVPAAVCSCVLEHALWVKLGRRNRYLLW